jgi:hypothetical protein
MTLPNSASRSIAGDNAWLGEITNNSGIS